MISEKALENLLQQQKIKIDALLISLEAEERALKRLWDEVGSSPETLSNYLDEKENFSEEQWEELQKQKTALLTKLEKNLSFIRNPVQAKKSFEDLNVKAHWLFVR